MSNCAFCNKETTIRSHKNHERCCPSNPNRNYKNGMTGKQSWNNGLTKDTDERIKISSEKLSEKMKNSEGHGFCSKEYFGSLEHKLNSSKGGGYRENAGRSKKFKVIDSFGKETTLQSSYELRCSEILNTLGIQWLRPKALKYDGRNYFADFYLPGFDIWLDPKNNYKAKLDEEKIQKVIDQNNVKLFVILENQLTEEFIKQLCS
jgi:hypothetical protein